MYVFYRNYHYVSNTSTMRTSSFYTHKVTVFENGNESLFQTLCGKHGNNRVSSNKKDLAKGSARIYVRETLRIARVFKPNKNHQEYTDKLCGKATVHNYCTNNSFELDYEDGILECKTRME